MDWNGLFDFQDDPKRNLLVQMGMGLLAGNQAGNPMAGAMRGANTAQEMQAQMTRLKMLQEQADMQKEEFGLRKDEYQRKLEEEAKRREAISRLGKGYQGYISEQEVPVESFQNVPIPAAEGAVAPNFGTARESVTTMQKKMVPNADALTADLIDAGYGPDIIKRTFLPEPKDPIKMGKSDRLIDPTTMKELVSAAPEELDPNKPFFFVDGKIVPNPSYQRYELAKAHAGAPKIPAIQVKLSEGLGSAAADRISAGAGAAEAAVANLSVISRMRTATKDKKVLIGPATKLRQGLKQVGVLMGTAGADDQETLNNTRMVVQGLAEMSLNARQELKGTGPITENEQAILNKARSGEIEDLTVGELNLLMGVSERAAKAKIAAHQRNLKFLRSRPETAELALLFDTVPVDDDLYQKYPFLERP